MYSEQDLEAAVAAGVIDRASVERLRAFLAAAQGAPGVDEEHFRLLTGFNDIFVSIAAVLLLASLAWLGKAVPLGTPDGAEALAGLLVAVASWGLAEYFTRRRRMALPSILLLLSFVGGLGAATFSGLHGILALHGPLGSNTSGGALLLAATAVVAAGGAGAHWRRFHVPITVAVASACGAGLALALLTAAAPALSDHLAALVFVAGLSVFALALRWDLTDPRRETRRADVAFWLHLLAAPMMVHPAFALSGLLQGDIGGGAAGVVLVLYIGLGLVALVIDRRALMVSALAYVIYALSSLFHRLGALNLSIAITALVLGGALLGLSAGWPRLRRAILSRLPPSLRRALPATTAPTSG